MLLSYGESVIRDDVEDPRSEFSVLEEKEKKDCCKAGIENKQWPSGFHVMDKTI